MPHASLLRRGSHALAATLLLTGIAAQAHAQQQPQAPPPAVGVRLAEIRGVARSYEFVGRIAATNTVQLRARVEGFLDKILFTEGQEVKTGQLLYQLEKSVYQAQVDQAKANLAAAQATAWNADIQYRRSYELAQHQNAPQSTVDQNKAAMDSAKASVLQNEAALQLAQINLGYTDIWAPVDGRIGRKAEDRRARCGEVSYLQLQAFRRGQIALPPGFFPLDPRSVAGKALDDGVQQVASRDRIVEIEQQDGWIHGCCRQPAVRLIGPG